MSSIYSRASERLFTMIFPYAVTAIIGQALDEGDIPMYITYAKEYIAIFTPDDTDEDAGSWWASREYETEEHMIAHSISLLLMHEISKDTK